MKKLSNITFAAILLGGVQLLQTGCTDMEGDGIGSIEWGGSTNVEAVSYQLRLCIRLMLIKIYLLK